MFPSSGLFININCPFSRHGLCERPHCLYKHATEARGTFGGVSKSPTAELTGNLYGNRFRPVNADSLHELQRLEKEIETARHEVEQEQRRLSCYQTNWADRSGNKPPTKCEASVSCGLPSSKGHKSSVQAMKYVVDSSKPRTDLEYDPLSNFSAALRSYSSSGKVKNRQDGRSSRSVEKPTTHQAQLNRPSSPPDLDDSFEDGVLVIDVSLSPDKTSDQTPNAAADVASETSSEGTERARKEIKTHNVLLDSSPQKITPQVVNAAWSSTASNNVNKEPDCCLIESNPVSSASEKAKDYSNDSSGFNLTGCLVELERGRENPGLRSPEMPTKKNESQSFSTTSDHLGNPHNKLISNTGKYNPQPHCSLFRKQPDPDSAKQALVTEVQSHVPYTQSAQSDAAAREKTAEKTNLQQADGGPGNSQIWSPDVASVNPHGRADSSDLTEQLHQEEDEAVIVINSSAEEDELDYSEMELSDSDPMEECYRIFMEANGEERGNEEQGSTSVSISKKLKQQSETAKEKVPHDVRQRYVNMFTEEFLKTTADVNEAFEKALTEEKSVYNRSVNKLKYLSIAVNALKRLKNQSASAKSRKKTGDMVLYEIFKGYTLTDEQMIENNYPIQHPEKASSAVLFSEKKVSTDPLKRICCRCGATYAVNQTGKHLRKEECNYHYGKGVTNRVPGGVETRYSCCQGVMGAPGCQMFKLHVHDFLSLDGFVSTAPRCPSDMSCPGVYSLDCEMCYTVQGLELSRVTVINSNLQVVYDTFVRPDNEVIDYNTRFSGISEEDVKGNHPSLREVQETLLSFISADTILVGHGLETDLCLLKLLHGLVVDTSVVFPHRLGPPNKLSLNSLTAEYLRRIIQESVCGHDTEEDASACMELMLWKMKEDGKLKK
uniref:Zgc:152968 n=1 Tax=Cyprinodon variegatus TaxID=28743 RepID=A0A3Q2FXR5_CYPVA